jgi:DNA polymerase III delta prime subunit
MKENFLWVEKYRPRTIQEAILPDELKQTFQQFVDQNNIPNLLLTGTAGIGKTTVARALCEELGADYIVINGSNEGRSIDVLRVEIQNFASSVSFSGGRKYVILDEADYLNANSVQPALRNFMEEYSSNCGFILTCNFKNRIIDPLQSRCSVIDFKFDKKIKATMAMQFMKRVEFILNEEEVKYDKKALAEVIQQHFPDWRRVLNELQRYSGTGSIDAGILRNWRDENLVSLMKTMKVKDFDGMRKWVFENSDTDSSAIFREVFDKSSDYIKPNSIPGVVVTLGEYQYKAAFVADAEINMIACLTVIMMEAEFK